MTHLVPCTGCSRHVDAMDATCPFCGETLPMSLRRRKPLLPTERMGRTAIMMFGAALATTGCGDDMSGTDAGDGTRDAGDGTMDAGDGMMDAGDGTMDAGDGTMDAGDGSDGGDSMDGAVMDDAGPGADGGINRLDGAVILRDGAIDRRDGGRREAGIVPLYGGISSDAGPATRDAGPQDGGGGITPLYGVPPSPAK